VKKEIAGKFPKQIGLQKIYSSKNRIKSGKQNLPDFIILKF
jgi:hypothetical protein